MPEQKAEKKKPVILRRIFKWLGPGLLSVLIILGLIFQAPWKVIALLLIILAACTQLPRPARKWFWLSVAAIIIALIIWVFLPDDNEGWRPYTFDKELVAIEKKYAIPDDENAATIYNSLLEDHDPNAIHPDFLDPNLDNLTLREPWSSEDYPELAKWLKGQQTTIETLIEASKIEKCAFPITHDILSMYDSTFYRLQIRGWAFLLVRAGNNDMAEGRIEEGLQKYICVKRIGDHMQQQSSMIEIMAGIAIEDLALDRFKTFVVTADATEKYLSLIEKAIADIKHDWATDWPRILDYEKIIFKNELARYYDINPRGKIRLSRDPLAQMRALWKEQLESEQKENQQIKEFLESYVYLHYWQKKLIKARTILYWFCIPSSPQGAFKLIDTCFEKYYAMADPNYPWPSQSPEFTLPKVSWLPWRFMDSAKPSEFMYHQFHDIYLRTIAGQRGIRILIALRRYKNKHGRWPQTLDNLKSLAPPEIFIDPINGSSFVYKLSEENFTLYSKGKNNIDEDGIRGVTFDPNDLKWPKTEEDDILIWPPKTCKTQKENEDVEKQ